MKTINIYSKIFSRGGIFFTILITLAFQTQAQYFGKNKPGYKVFDYDVLGTPNFEIYHNFNNDSVIHELGAMSEYWYNAHSLVFGDTLSTQNPIIFYENHADFQQTNVASDIIGIGTGGFTEGLKNRVVMPVSITKSQTNHVLGHELVHAFQYNMMTTDSLTLQNMSNIPLWMIEGLAEYMSIGSIDPQTSMWIRDIIINKKFPDLNDLSRRPDLNPYRFGQAFWTFTAKTWGDSIIKPLFVTTAKYGIKPAIDSVLGVKMDTLSKMWKDSTEKHFKALMIDSVDHLTGTKLINEKNAGELNISPVISPDGKYVAFMSEKDLFSIDLYVADLKTGKIVSKLASTTRNDEIDDFNWIESSGTWSPDSKKLAYVIFTKGENRLIIIDVRKNKITNEISMQGVNEFSNPSWSPDGNNIIFSGTRRGISNLYEYNLNSEDLIQITEEGYSYVHPSWSPDGKYVVFATDKDPVRGKRVKGYVTHAFNIGIMHIKSGETEILNLFPGAGNLNPVFSEDGRSIYFLSDRDGFRNLYRYSIEEKKVYQLTDYLTGITGITMLSPALSVVGDDVVYSYFADRKYFIYKAKTADFKEEEVNPFLLTYAASTLPPLKREGKNLVDYMLLNQPEIQSDLRSETDEYKEISYKPKFKLDYISNINAGVSTSRFGTGMAGSVAAIFSDIVGNNKIFTVLALNGEIYDFGGQVAYLNEKRKLKWGAAVSHIPYLYGYREFFNDSIEIGGEMYPVINGAININRLFETKASMFGYIPFSITRRIESGISLARYYYRLERYNYYYDQNGFYIGQDRRREKLDAPPGFTLAQADIAYVHDNSNFGVTAPVLGSRARYGVTAYTGTYNFFSTLVDYRKYFFAKPVTFAFRFYNSNRFGKDASVFAPEYLGYPWLIRGYDGSSGDISNVSIEQLLGTRLAVANAEIRIPFTGPRRFSLIKSKLFFTDIAFFADAGLAWDEDHNPELKWEISSSDDRIPLVSAGASLRINLFGALIIEPYYAFPFQNGGFENGRFGLNFVPGW